MTADWHNQPPIRPAVLDPGHRGLRGRRFGGLLLGLAFAFSLGAVVLSRMGAVTPVR